MNRNIKVAVICIIVGLIAVCSISAVAIIKHNTAVSEPTIDFTVEETTGETIPSEDYEDVQVVYNVDLKDAGGTRVPTLVYNYRLENPVESGTITVNDYYYDDDDNLVIVMDINGVEVTYSEAPEGFNG